jgi:hypothetical protein
MAYVTTASIKQWLEITTSTDDTVIAEAILDAQAFIEEQTGRVFEASADTTRYFDPVCDANGRTLNLDYDLLSITTLTNGDTEVIPSTAYTLQPANSQPYRQIVLKASQGYTWQYVTDHENAISVLGRWAYSLTVPQAIERIARELACYFYRKRGPTADADRPIMTGDGGVLMPNEIPSNARRSLRAYARRM